MRTLKATPLGPRLPPLAAAEAHSDPPHRRLSGIEPQQPDAPQTTASATDPTLPPRCRSRPATLAPPQDAYQLQLCRARRAISPRFPISPALLHQHHAQPRRFLQHRSRSARACMQGHTWPDGVYKVGVYCAMHTDLGRASGNEWLGSRNRFFAISDPTENSRAHFSPRDATSCSARKHAVRDAVMMPRPTAALRA